MCIFCQRQFYCNESRLMLSRLIWSAAYCNHMFNLLQVTKNKLPVYYLVIIITLCRPIVAAATVLANFLFVNNLWFWMSISPSLNLLTLKLWQFHIGCQSSKARLLPIVFIITSNFDNFDCNTLKCYGADFTQRG